MHRVVALLAACFALAAVPALAAPGSVSTGFTGTHSSRGAFVDVTANQPLNVTGFALNIASGPVVVTIYRKSGPTAGSETNAAAWTVVNTINANGSGFGTPTNVTIPPVAIGAGQTMAFYVSTDADGHIANFCCGAPSGVTTASNAAVSVVGAYDAHGLFASVYNGWGFEGTVTYDTTNGVAGATVPTLSEWGLVVLTLLLGVASVLQLRGQSARR